MVIACCGSVSSLTYGDYSILRVVGVAGLCGGCGRGVCLVGVCVLVGNSPLCWHVYLRRMNTLSSVESFLYQSLCSEWVVRRW